ncbi:hypothetical protein [Streptosporangium sp. NPDC051022]|uniref:hypothetical protein n=1 Tax=Streptosporangium sp. NPDC051022 TaxID=3155752 RepID=UPI003429ACF4
MKFRDLTPGTLARIPLVYRLPDSPTVPAAVEILAPPAPCRNVLCPAWDVMARVIETGEERPYHRRPEFEVVLITPQAEEV